MYRDRPVPECYSDALTNANKVQFRRARLQIRETRFRGDRDRAGDFENE